MTITATATSLATLTVERIIDVPELRGTRLREQAERNTFSGPVRVLVERRDGQFVCDHGSDQSPDRPSYTHMWDYARHVAERTGLRYVGPGREGDYPAGHVRLGWHVRLAERGPWLRVVEVVQHVNLATLRRTGQVRYRRVTLILEGGAERTLSTSAYVAARPVCA